MGLTQEIEGLQLDRLGKPPAASPPSLGTVAPSTRAGAAP